MTKILLVEDNEKNRDLLSRRLTHKGFDVVVAEDGQQGVDMAASEKPDLVLMDMNLRDLDGSEATRMIKASEETAVIPVIALIEPAIAEDREKALSAGCDDYDAKPIELERLLEKINKLLDKSVHDLAAERKVWVDFDASGPPPGIAWNICEDKLQVVVSPEAHAVSKQLFKILGGAFTILFAWEFGWSGVLAFLGIAGFWLVVDGARRSFSEVLIKRYVVVAPTELCFFRSSPFGISGRKEIPFEEMEKVRRIAEDTLLPGHLRFVSVGRREKIVIESDTETILIGGLGDDQLRWLEGLLSAARIDSPSLIDRLAIVSPPLPTELGLVAGLKPPWIFMVVTEADVLKAMSIAAAGLYAFAVYMVIGTALGIGAFAGKSGFTLANLLSAVGVSFGAVFIALSIHKKQCRTATVALGWIVLSSAFQFFAAPTIEKTIMVVMGIYVAYMAVAGTVKYHTFRNTSVLWGKAIILTVMTIVSIILAIILPKILLAEIGVVGDELEHAEDLYLIPLMTVAVWLTSWRLLPGTRGFAMIGPTRIPTNLET